MGKLLASTTGEGHRDIMSRWLACLANGGLFLFLTYASIPGTSYNINNFGKFLIVLSMFNIYNSFNEYMHISKTSVYVYEHGIKGAGVVPATWFALRPMSEFQLTYDRILSIDIENVDKLIISDASAKHKIFAMNASEIRDIILSQKDTATNTKPEVPPISSPNAQTPNTASVAPTEVIIVFCQNCGRLVTASAGQCGACGTPSGNNQKSYALRKQSAQANSQSHTLSSNETVITFCQNCGKPVVASSGQCIGCGTPSNMELQLYVLRRQQS